MIAKIIADIRLRFPDIFTSIMNMRNATNNVSQLSINELIQFFDDKSMFIEIKYSTPTEWQFSVNKEYTFLDTKSRSVIWSGLYKSRPLAQQAAIKYVCELIRSERIDKSN